MPEMPEEPLTSRRVPVALYVVTGDVDAAPLLTDYCTRYAHARDWPTVETITDTDHQAPLLSRPGWERVLALLSSRAAHGVITYSPGMIAASAEEFEAVRELLRERGAFLVAARLDAPSARTSPRRTPAQTARRRALADAAYKGRGAERGRSSE